MLIQLPIWGGGGGVGIFSGGVGFFSGGVGADIWGGSTPPNPPGKSAYDTNLVIPGSCLNSDLTTPMGYIKHKTKAILLNIQCLGDPIHWLSDKLNFTI